MDQTNIYIPAPVADGHISKNAFGNLDIYVPSMIPPGAVHVHALEASKAAKVLGIDYADAVVGFKFQGRRGTAIMDGVVVAKEYEDAMKETILGLRWQIEREEQEKRGKEAIKWWKKFMVGLRVRERIMGYEIESEQKSEAERDREVHEKMDEVDDEGEGGHRVEQGGFLPDVDQGPSAQPTAGNKQDEPETFGAGDVSINDFDSIIPVPRIDNRLIVTPSPWDEGGALYHLNPHKVSPLRRKPQLPRTHTTGLFLSPTRPDQEIESGGGFFGEDELERGEMDDGSLRDHDDINDNVHTMPPPGIRTYDSLFDEPNEAEAEAETQEPVAVEEEMHEAEEEEGGGFIADEADIAETEAEMNGGGFLVDDNDNTAEQVDTHMSGAIGPGSDEQASPSGDTREEAEAAAMQDKHVLTRKAGEAITEDEANSLLSHDEDDEDAEPEWLVDEIGW